MSTRTLLAITAAGRVAIGTALVVAPAAAGRVWVGRGAARPQTRVFIRATGARDLALGAGALAALRAGHPVRAWMLGALAADAADAAATLLAGEVVPPRTRAAFAALAGAAALQDAWLAARQR